VRRGNEVKIRFCECVGICSDSNESRELGEAPLWIASEVRFQSLLLFAEPASFQHCVSFSCGLILLKSRLGLFVKFCIGDLLNTEITMGEEDTKVIVEPTANGTSSLPKPSDEITGKQAEENATVKETQENKKAEDNGSEKMVIDDDIKQDEEKEVSDKETKAETEKDVNGDKEPAETAETNEDKGQPEADQMDEDTDGKKLEADDGLSGGATAEDTVMKESVESDDKRETDTKGAENQVVNKIDTTEGSQDKTEKESEEEKLLGGDEGDSVDEVEKRDTSNKEEAPKERNEGEMAEDGKEEKPNKEEEVKEANKEEEDTDVNEPKEDDEKIEAKGEDGNDIDDSKDEIEDKEEETKDEKEDEKEESNDEKEDEKEKNNDDKEDENEDSKKSSKRGKGKNEKARGKTKSEEEKKDAEPETPYSDRPVRERKSVERLVAVIDKDSSKEFQVEKGKGTPLKDIPNVAYKIARKKSEEVFKLLHTILFGGRRGRAAQVKANILRFSGYKWQGDEEKAKDKIKEKLDKCNKEKLLEFCDLFDISVAKATTKKEDIVAKLFKFLEKPHATTDVPVYEKEKGAKRKRTPTKSSHAAGSSSSKRSAKSQKKTDKKSLPHSDDESEEEKEEEEEEREHETEEEDEKIDEEEENENGIPDQSDDEAPQPSESEEKVESEEDSESEEETKKKKRGSRTVSGKKESTAGKSRSKKAAVSTKSSPPPTKVTQKRSAGKRKKSDDDDSDTSPKASSSKRKKTEKPAKEQSSVPSKSASKEKPGKRGGKGKDKTKEPSDEELKNAIVDILKEVDFNTATFTDILNRLAGMFKLDLTSRKSSIKLMIQDELTKLADEAENEVGEEDAEKEKAGGEEVKA
ncbi:hypothetical protein HID58_038380, partial [Brassica napus]